MKLTIRRTIAAALTAPKALAYRTLSGIVAALVDAGQLVRTGDLLDRLGADDLKDGHRSWYGRHVAKAYRAANDGADAIRVWAQHRTTGKWNHVHAYNPVEPALFAGLRSYKATQHLTQAAFTEAAQTTFTDWPEPTAREVAGEDRKFWTDRFDAEDRDYDDTTDD